MTEQWNYIGVNRKTYSLSMGKGPLDIHFKAPQYPVSKIALYFRYRFAGSHEIDISVIKDSITLSTTRFSRMGTSDLWYEFTTDFIWSPGQVYILRLNPSSSSASANFLFLATSDVHDPDSSMYYNGVALTADYEPYFRMFGDPTAIPQPVDPSKRWDGFQWLQAETKKFDGTNWIIPETYMTGGGW